MMAAGLARDSGHLVQQGQGLVTIQVLGTSNPIVQPSSQVRAIAPGQREDSPTSVSGLIEPLLLE